MSAASPFAKPPARLRPRWPFTVRPPDWAAIIRYGLDSTTEIKLSPALKKRAVHTTDA